MTGPQVVLTVPGATWQCHMDPAPAAGEPHTVHQAGASDRVVGSIDLGFIGGRPVRMEASRAYLERLEAAIRWEIARLDSRFDPEAVT